MDNHNFWNNWSFKDILQISLIIIGFVIAYTKLEARVDSNERTNKIDMDHLERSLNKIEVRIDKLTDEIKQLNK